MTVLVYPHGAGRPDTLRWSLRSVAAHGGDVAVIVAGHIPAWLATDAAVALHSRQQPRRAAANVWHAIGAAARLLGPDTPFVLMNDDFFATGPVDWSRMVNAGPADRHIDRMRASPHASYYRARLARSVRLVTGHGRTAPASWETHTPLPLTTEAVAAARSVLDGANLPASTVAQRTLMAELAGVAGEAIDDVKVRGGADAGPLPSPWVSTDTAAWSGATGARLRARFPTPSPWEAGEPAGDGAALHDRPRSPHRPTGTAQGRA